MHGSTCQNGVYCLDIQHGRSFRCHSAQPKARMMHQPVRKRAVRVTRADSRAPCGGKFRTQDFLHLAQMPIHMESFTEVACPSSDAARSLIDRRILALPSAASWVELLAAWSYCHSRNQCLQTISRAKCREKKHDGRPSACTPRWRHYGRLQK